MCSAIRLAFGVGLAFAVASCTVGGNVAAIPCSIINDAEAVARILSQCQDTAVIEPVPEVKDEVE
jgi:hypothetical protein